MAARAGPRAAGTDGSDFQHREQVASHYQASVASKLNIRKSLVPHMFLTVLAFGRLASVSFGIKYFKPAETWELSWILSGIAAYIGYGSLPRNSVPQLLAYIFGNILFGILPLSYGAWTIVRKSLHLYRKGSSFGEWQEAPMKVALIAVCLQVQIIGLFHALRLYRAWTSKGRKGN